MVADDREKAWLFHYQRGVLSREQALACGLTPDALRHRARPGGPWQRLLPGIYLTATGQPTREQFETAAVLYAGPASVITGATALRNYKIRAPQTRLIQVLMPLERRRASRAFVTITRTSRLPDAQTRDLAIGYVAPARAVADTVRRLTTRSEVRAIVASAVQQGRCTIAELAAELAAGPVRGSALFRSVLAEVRDGIRSPAEADFRDLIRKSGLPQPLFNPQLILDGALLARPDAWWPDRALVVEIDSREWHLSPDDWEATMARDGRLRAVGIRVIHVSPRQVRTEPNRILATIADALRTGAPVPGLITVPATA
jgi:very-short-patch-repair endonuclease